MDSVHHMHQTRCLADPDDDPPPRYPPPLHGRGVCCVPADVAQDAEHLITAALRLARLGDIAAAEWCGHLLPVACVIAGEDVRADALVPALIRDLESDGRSAAVAAIERAARLERRSVAPGTLDWALAGMLLRIPGVSRELVAGLVGVSESSVHRLAREQRSTFAAAAA